MTGPTPAERARTTLAHAAVLWAQPGRRRPAEPVRGTGEAAAAHLDHLHDVHAVEPDGSVLVLAPASSPLADAAATQAGAVPGTVPVVVHAAVVCPLTGADRRVDDVSVVGRLELVDAGACGPALEVLVDAHPTRRAAILLRPEESALLRITPVQVRLGGLPVDPDAYRRAVPDPLAAESDEAVAHLLQCHPGDVMTLVRLVDPDLIARGESVAPVRLDRYGLTMRVELADGGVADVRCEFPLPLGEPDEAPHAVRALIERAAALPCRCAGRECRGSHVVER